MTTRDCRGGLRKSSRKKQGSQRMESEETRHEEMRRDVKEEDSGNDRERIDGRN